MIFYIISAIYTIVHGVITLPLVMVNPFPIGCMLAQFWCKCLLCFSKVCDGVTYEVIGKENIPDGPCIIASEHQSPIETLILFSEIENPVIVMKKELKAFPIIGQYCMSIGMIFIDRKKGIAAIRRLIKKCGEYVKKGRSIIIFPEGTRTNEGDRNARKYGSGLAAVYRKLEIPVVPVVLNTGEYWPRAMVSFEKKRGKAIVKVLPPIMQGLEKDEFTRVFKERIIEGSKSLTQ